LGAGGMNFIKAAEEAIKGRKIKRKIWDNNNHEVYITANHPLNSLIMEDLMANDWEVVK
jgi:hypothetical protein